MSSINAAVDGVIVTADSTAALDLSTGGTVRMTVNSSGNVGVGTTSPGNKLQVAGTSGSSQFKAGTASNGYFEINAFDSNPVYCVVGGSNATAGVFGTQSNIPSIFFTNNAERMRIDSSGNVGIGTSSPTDKLHVAGGSGSTIRNTASAGSSWFVGSNVDSYILHNESNTPMLMTTNNTERMRITAGGEVYIAGTADQGAYNLQCNGTGVWGAGAYVNGSDARIKEDVNPIASGLDVIEKLNPVTYRYKESWTKDQSVQTGFIAQELLTALEGQVYVDGVVQQGGSEGYYSVAYQNIIPILTKAVQELKAENDAMKARLDALENK